MLFVAADALAKRGKLAANRGIDRVWIGRPGGGRAGFSGGGLLLEKIF